MAGQHFYRVLTAGPLKQALLAATARGIQASPLGQFANGDVSLLTFGHYDKVVEWYRQGSCRTLGPDEPSGTKRDQLGAIPVGQNQ